MREIKFRGMKENGEWVVGYYLVHIPTDEHKIHYLSKILGMSTAIVDKKTVGQFTGLLDKNGKEIYEGDRVKWNGYYFGDSWQKAWEGVVVFENGGFRIKHGLEEMNNYLPPDFCSEDIYNCSIEVIGNIYDQPELLKGGEST